MKTQSLPWLLLFLSLGLASCATTPAGRDSAASDAAGRRGPSGTLAAPVSLNPFKDYDLVLAGGENRYFKMQLPGGWYWKLFVTAVNRSDDQEGKLEAQVLPSQPPWQALPLCLSDKVFNLKTKEGDQAVLGAANNGPDHAVVVELTQQGPPILVTLHSEVSPLSGVLLRPLGWRSTVPSSGVTEPD